MNNIFSVVPQVIHRRPYVYIGIHKIEIREIIFDKPLTQENLFS